MDALLAAWSRHLCPPNRKQAPYCIAPPHLLKEVLQFYADVVILWKGDAPSFRGCYKHDVMEWRMPRSLRPRPIPSWGREGIITWATPKARLDHNIADITERPLCIPLPRGCWQRHYVLLHRQFYVLWDAKENPSHCTLHCSHRAQ